HVDDQPVDHGDGIDEAWRRRRLRLHGLRRQQQQRQRGMGGSMHHCAFTPPGTNISQIMAFRRIPRQRPVCRGPGVSFFDSYHLRCRWNFCITQRLNRMRQTDRRTVMRHSTVPIIAAVALSLTFPSSADARPRFGPAALLGAVAGFALLGGFRHSSRHHRHSATHPSLRQRSARAARMERRAALSAHRPWARPPAEPPAAPPSERTAPTPPERTAPTPPEQTAAIFWPEAARDLVDYVLLPRGNDRFWAYGYDAFVQPAFAPSTVADP